LKYVAFKNKKEFMRDLKPVYRDATKEDPKTASEVLEAK